MIDAMGISMVVTGLLILIACALLPRKRRMLGNNAAEEGSD